MYGIITQPTARNSGRRRFSVSTIVLAGFHQIRQKRAAICAVRAKRARSEAAELAKQREIAASYAAATGCSLNPSVFT